jgi:hypothetical protein
LCRLNPLVYLERRATLEAHLLRRHIHRAATGAI